MQVKPNCFEKTKVRWGIFKKLSPTKLHSEQSAPLAANAHALCEGPVRQQVLWPFAKGHVRRSSPLKGDCDARKGRERSVAIGRGSLLQRGELRPNVPSIGVV